MTKSISPVQIGLVPYNGALSVIMINDEVPKIINVALIAAALSLPRHSTKHPPTNSINPSASIAECSEQAVALTVEFAIQMSRTRETPSPIIGPLPIPAPVLETVTTNDPVMETSPTVDTPPYRVVAEPIRVALIDEVVKETNPTCDFESTPSASAVPIPDPESEWH
jgi:predicted membrane-bound mannosyltransferase